ncbi:sulfite exporter TauE/SafE family protein [Methanoculleus sp. FWC-SCC1]|uniref:Sulfite exporter TauE/SafE family protein n=1 Tax=Methanoculleus frigidifontis TaxID=2584085 RepID=A0ABT8M820_9EURY|nr:aromatic aminobenezylarsenical efflux permease ArsG family transporter [Methanoculleus sp. FWC-SCC1]MDN7024049.1 sulfite exporter TauE/SafE family protein [Methanoculleus sp. FWC-SCC1]
MNLMGFMETMGTSSIPLVAAFFIGLMMALSPCPLATNIAAIGYLSRRIGSPGQTLLAGSLYGAGRMVVYVGLAALIVMLGLNVQAVSLFLQAWGEVLVGPLLIGVGIVMLDLVPLSFGFGGSSRLAAFKERLANQGLAGSFLLGVLFALAFCPFSAVLFFAMLVPLALRTGDPLGVPAVFAVATALPVIAFSLIMVTGATKVGSAMKAAETFEFWMRRIVGVLFIGIGVYLLAAMLLG